MAGEGAKQPVTVTRDHLYRQVWATPMSKLALHYGISGSTLEVEFQNGGIYQYFGVPQNMFEQLMQAPSKGKFINIYIKNAYAFSKVG